MARNQPLTDGVPQRPSWPGGAGPDPGPGPDPVRTGTGSGAFPRCVRRPVPGPSGGRAVRPARRPCEPECAPGICGRAPGRALCPGTGGRACMVVWAGLAVPAGGWSGPGGPQGVPLPQSPRVADRPGRLGHVSRAVAPPGSTALSTAPSSARPPPRRRHINCGMCRGLWRESDVSAGARPVPVALLPGASGAVVPVAAGALTAGPIMNAPGPRSTWPSRCPRADRSWRPTRTVAAGPSPAGRSPCPPGPVRAGPALLISGRLHSGLTAV